MEGWVDLGYPAMHRPGTELGISRSLVRRPTTTLTEQLVIPVVIVAAVVVPYSVQFFIHRPASFSRFMKNELYVKRRPRSEIYFSSTWTSTSVIAASAATTTTTTATDLDVLSDKSTFYLLTYYYYN